MKQTVLITGAAGQDGSYLAELLAGRGARVIGAVRDLATARERLPAAATGRLELVSLDLDDHQAIADLIDRYRPAQVFNLAALSSGAGMFDDAVRIGEVNGLAVARMLNAVRAIDPAIRFCQASSSEIFGMAETSPQSETTPVNPRSPYGAAKVYADAMVRIYRQSYGMFACSAILFNHESPRRRLDSVARKITRGAASIKLGLSAELRLGSLDARRDWSFAGDLARGMAGMMALERPEDFVLATGESHSVRDWCEFAFQHVGLDYRDYVRKDSASFRPPERVPLVGDIAKARQLLGWEPEVRFRELVAMLVDADIAALRP